MSCVSEPVALPFGMYSEAEERANRLTHGLGFVLSVCGAIYLLATASAQHGWERTLACMLYAGSLSAVYAMSTLSHGPFSESRRALFRSLDQGFIYLLIAGSFTPLAVAYLPPLVCWLILGAMWTIALTGFAAKVFFAHQVNAVSVWVYVLLGWMPILATPWLIGTVPLNGLLLGLGGGLCYTVGTVFLVFDNRVAYFHALWHVLVMAGSTLHFLTILCYVARMP
jgi:hemolysin III